MRPAALLPLLALLACAHAPGPRRPAPAGALAPLAFIEGAWRSEARGTTVEEHWNAPRAGSMLGTGRVIVGERTVFFEFLRVEATGDGVVYVAMPRGGAATAFRLESAGGNEAVFVNPGHDFPSRITYRRAADGALVTRVEGVEDGRPRVEETRLQPVR
jgi:hypothetical protein